MIVPGQYRFAHLDAAATKILVDDLIKKHKYIFRFTATTVLDLLNFFRGSRPSRPVFKLNNRKSSNNEECVHNRSGGYKGDLFKDEERFRYLDQFPITGPDGAIKGPAWHILHE